MKTYAITLTKTIVVCIEADSVEEAYEYVSSDESGYDGAWDRAEISVDFIVAEG